MIKYLWIWPCELRNLHLAIYLNNLLFLLAFLIVNCYVPVVQDGHIRPIISQYSFHSLKFKIHPPCPIGFCWLWNWFFVRPQFVDTLFIVRLRSKMSMRRAVVINYYFLVHKIEVEKLPLLSTHVSLKCNEVSLA